MLTHPILDQLTELRLIGMHKALGEQLDMNDLQTLSFDERLGDLLRRLEHRVEVPLRFDGDDNMQPFAPRGLDEGVVSQRIDLLA